jgi:hypothetical protein
LYVTTNTIGKLTNSTVLSSYDVKLSCFKSHYLEDSFEANGLLKPFYFKVLNNREMCLAYRYGNGKYIKISLFDVCFRSLDNKNVYINADCAKFEITEMNDSIVVCLIQCESVTKPFSVIKKYTKSLSAKIKELRIEYEMDSIDGYENSLYIAKRTMTLKEENWLLSVNILDESLVLLKSIQQSDLTHPFSNELRIESLRVTERYYVFLVGNTIILMNRTNHKMSKRIYISKSKFILNSSKNAILVHDSELDEMVSYDFQGEAQHFKLKGMSDGVKFVGCSNDTNFFFL